MSAEAAAEAAEVAADAKAAKGAGAQKSDDNKAAEDQVDLGSLPADDPAADAPPGNPAIVKCEPREEALGLGTALEHMEEFADEDDDCLCTHIEHSPG